MSGAMSMLPITIALLAAYAFAWIDFRGRDLLFVAVFALQIVPLQVTLIPLLSIYVDNGLAGSFWTVWLSHSIFALPLAIFMFHNFMKDIPRSLVEAARVDGAGHVGAFLRIFLPLSVPAAATVAVFAFVWTWNDFQLPLVFLHSPENHTLALGLAAFKGGPFSNTHVHLLMAASVLVIAPCIVVFFFAQRLFLVSVRVGGLKA